MASEYSETQMLYSPIVFNIVALAAVATIAFMVFCYFMNYVTELWEVLVLTTLCILFILAAKFMKYTITVKDGTFSIRYIRTFSFPLDDVLDLKKGDIDVLRNYSGWGLKRIKFKTYACPGIEDAISIKLAGRIVLTVTTTDVDTLYNILYENRRKD